jgi:hypothetical protein
MSLSDDDTGPRVDPGPPTTIEGHHLWFSNMKIRAFVQELGRVGQVPRGVRYDSRGLSYEHEHVSMAHNEDGHEAEGGQAAPSHRPGEVTEDPP